MDIRDIPTYWITIESAKSRHERMRQLFSSVGFNETRQINGEIVDRDGKSANRIKLEKSQHVAMSHVLAMQRPGPILILEDDCWFTNGFSPILEDVPADADAIYLGTSIWGVVDGRPRNRGTRFEIIDGHWDRPLNMLGLHAVLYLTESYKDQTVANLLSAKLTNKICDEPVASDMINHRIYSCASPLFFQKDRAAEIATSVKLRELIK